jgi:hypothetical protein
MTNCPEYRELVFFERFRCSAESASTDLRRQSFWGRVPRAEAYGVVDDEQPRPRLGR